MATDQKVQIEVELVGVKEAEKNLKAIESGGEQIGESFSKSSDEIKKSAGKIRASADNIGEGFNQAGSIISTFESEGSEALGSVGEGLSSVTEAFAGFSDAASQGGVSLGALALPAGAALVAIYELIKAFQEYRDEVSGVTLKVEAYKASMAEVTSAVEELAAKQVKLTKEEAKGLQTRAIIAKSLLEEAQAIAEKTSKQEKEILQSKEHLRVSKERLKSQEKQIGLTFSERKSRSSTISQISRLTDRIKELTKAQKENLDSAVELYAKGGTAFAKFEEFKEQLAQRSPEFTKQIAEQNFKLDMESAAIRIRSQKNTARAEKQIALIEYSAKVRELGKLEGIDEKSRSSRIKAAKIELDQRVKQIDRANYERIKAVRAARAKAELAEQKNQINAQSALEMARINQNLKGEENATNRKIALADLAFNRASQLLDLEADKNANSQDLKEALEINHQNRLAEIRDKAVADRIAKEQAATRELIANEMRAREEAFALDQLRAEVKMQGQDRELELLRLNYENQRHLATDNQEKLTLLQEQYSQQRIAIQNKESEALTDQMAGFFGSYGQGLADAAVGAVMFGESFSDSVKAVLDGLAREAGVQALMELAKGTAALFTNPAGSGAHFKAAGMFTAAALLAKGAGAGLGGGAGASAAGASGQASSPSGAPQTASAPRREQAEESTMVFNLNFSNSVIYDTKQAAQDAMVDQLVRNINTPRRGSRRVRFANA